MASYKSNLVNPASRKYCSVLAPVSNFTIFPGPVSDFTVFPSPVSDFKAIPASRRKAFPPSNKASPARIDPGGLLNISNVG